MLNLAGKANQAETPNELLFNLKFRGRLIAGFAMLSLVFATAAQAGSTTTGHGEEASEHAVTAALDEGHGEAAEEASDPKHATKKGSAPHWTYAGAKDGPDAWGSLATDFEACSAGRMQSPINLDGDASVGAEAVAIEFDYHMTPLTILHNGHTVQVNYAKGSGITIGGERYELLQFHFHSPSEHLVAGAAADMEMHFVHINGKGELAVVGVMFDAGSENLALREIWAAMPKKSGAPREHENVVLNGRDFLPGDRSYYRYMGSLTTPPCSEGVNWYVLTGRLAVSAEQVKKFARAIGEANARPEQALNHRLLMAPLASN